MILDIFTESHGLLSFIMNGVFKKSDQRLASILSTGNLIHLVAYYSEHKTLHRLKEVQFSFIYQNIRQDMIKSAMMIFMTELSAKSIKDHQINADLFQYLYRCYILLDNLNPLDPDFHLKFMLGMSRFLGFYPSEKTHHEEKYFDLLNGVFVFSENQNHHLVNEQDSALLDQFISGKSIQNNSSRNHFTLDQRKRLLDILIRYYSVHVEHFIGLQSPAVYKSIFG